MLDLAPSGYPSFATLRRALVNMDAKHDVLGRSDKGRFRAASTSADVRRNMCKDVVKLKKAGLSTH